MVQVLESNTKPTFGQKLGAGIPQALDTAQKLMGRHEENQASEKYGFSLKGFQDPSLRKEIFSRHIQGQMQQKKDQQQEFQDLQNYDKIKDTFGQKFAEVWRAAPTGGKTELLKHGIDAVLRGHNIDNLLEGVKKPDQNSSERINEQSEKPPQMKNGKIDKDFDWPNFKNRPAGYTPKDWANERSDWRKENVPVFKEITTKLKNISRDRLASKKLNQLNESRKLPEGLERYMINPETGELYGLAQISNQASPETQEWIKENARFQNRAKDSFGSRVTNFDLVSYMKQFPGLMNTYEGRKRILKMMNINYQLDELHDKALQQVFNKYGLSGIPQEEAYRLAEEMIGDDTQKLHNEYLGLDQQNQKQDEEKNKNKIIDVMGPDGQEYEINADELDQLPEGYRII